MGPLFFLKQGIRDELTPGIQNIAVLHELVDLKSYRYQTRMGDLLQGLVTILPRNQ